jgi:hypothetical protein
MTSPAQIRCRRVLAKRALAPMRKCRVRTLRTWCVAVVVLAGPACHFSQRWGSDGALLVGREGLISTFDTPGANPTNAPGIDKDVPPLTEDNVVEITRIAGVVGVRPAGERGVRNLEYYRARIQTGPRGVVLTQPNATAKLGFSDESSVYVHHSGLLWLGDPARNEPWITCGRLTTLELTIPAEAKFNMLELPGGARLLLSAQTQLKVSLERDRYYQIRNQGRATIELQVGGHSSFLKTGDWVDLPVIRNAPAGVAKAVPASAEFRATPADASATELREVRIGDATFSTHEVEFFPFLDSRVRQTRTAGLPPAGESRSYPEH